MTDSRIAAALADLRARYAASIGETIERFSVLAEALARDPADREALEALRHEAHRMYGTAGSLGFTAVGEAAAELEREALEWGTGAPVAGDRAERVRAFAAALPGRLARADGAERS